MTIHTPGQAREAQVSYLRALAFQRTDKATRAMLAAAADQLSTDQANEAIELLLQLPKNGATR